MKRYRIVAIAIAWHVSLLAAMAQVGEHRSEMAVGGSAGYVMSSIGFLPRVPQSQHAGVTAGVSLRYTSEKYFNSICAIVGEVNYARTGWKESILDIDDNPVKNLYTNEPEAYRRDMTYVQVPVMARMGWGRERRGLQFFVQAGPQAGYFLGERTVMNFELEKRNVALRTSQVVAQDTMGVEHKVDYGICAGAGVEFSHPKAGHFILEGRYYYGLGDIYGNSKRDYFGRSNFSLITVKVSYLFDILKTTNQKIK